MPRIDLDPNDVRRMHVDKRLSVLAISKLTGFSRFGLVAFMHRHDIPVRGRSDANRERMKRVGSSGRAKLVAAAHTAVRGTHRSREQKLRSAATLAVVGRMTALERVFFDAMVARGFRVVPQLQVDIFNIDLALPDHMIAVEIDPGHWHSAPKKRREDATKDAALGGAGWRVVRFGGWRVRLGDPRLHDYAVECVATITV